MLAVCFVRQSTGAGIPWATATAAPRKVPLCVDDQPRSDESNLTRVVIFQIFSCFA